MIHDTSQFLQRHLPGRLAADISWIAVQSPELRPSRDTLRHVPCTVLLRIPDGTVWLLSATDHAWNATALRQAATLLGELGDTWSRHSLGARLSDELEVPRIGVEDFHLNQSSQSLFRLDKVEHAITRNRLVQAASPLVLAQLIEERHEVLRKLVDQADAALREFLTQLDAEVLSHLQPRGQLASEFNYLAKQPHSLYRMQFARFLPLMLGAVFRADSDKRWGAVRAAIDAGISPVRVIATQFQVSSSTVRTLRQVGPAQAGKEWEEKPQRLLGVLESIAPEHRPRTDGQWRVLARQHMMFTNLFSGSPAHATLIGSMLRHAMRSAVAKNEDPPAAGPNEVMEVERLRDALKKSAMCIAGQANPRSGSDVERSAAIALRLDRYLGALSWPRLTELARKYSREYVAASARDRTLTRFLDGQEYWCFIPGGEFVASNGLKVLCLADTAGLLKHGRALRNCLAGEHLAYYHDACTSGQTMVVAVLARESDSTLSTAEFQITTAKKASPLGASRTIKALLMQHAGPGNERPGTDEAQAIAELVAMFALPEWQLNARKGIWAAAQRSSSAAQSATDGHLLSTMRVAFDRTFGAIRAARLFREIVNS